VPDRRKRNPPKKGTSPFCSAGKKKKKEVTSRESALRSAKVSERTQSGKKGEAMDLLEKTIEIQKRKKRASTS